MSNVELKLLIHSVGLLAHTSIKHCQFKGVFPAIGFCGLPSCTWKPNTLHTNFYASLLRFRAYKHATIIRSHQAYTPESCYFIFYVQKWVTQWLKLTLCTPQSQGHYADLDLLTSKPREIRLQPQVNSEACLSRVNWMQSYTSSCNFSFQW